METELVLAILSSLAQEESESISKNVKWGNQKRIKSVSKAESSGQEQPPMAMS